MSIADILLMTGVCDAVIGDRIAIRDGDVVEIAVPMDRVRKLVMALENSSVN